MEVERFDDPTAFRRVAEPLLMADEAANNLILGVSSDASGESTYETFRGWVVRHADDIVAAAGQTPPHNLILARSSSPEAIDAIAVEVTDVPGVTGTLPEVEIFVARHPERRRTMRQGIYRLTEVRSEFEPKGCRRASVSDRELLAAWMVEFTMEVAPHIIGPDRASDAIDTRLRGPDDTAGMWLLEVDGEPVSMSGYRSPTPTGIRIGPVYTPPDRRGHGFASRLVAALSQRLLDSGRQFCFLYTDLDNPTSNSIYQRIGYEMVAEGAEYSFSQSP